MIDLTRDVSPSVLTQTAAKLEAEQKQRDDADAQQALVEAVKPYEARLVSGFSRLISVSRTRSSTMIVMRITTTVSVTTNRLQ